MNIDELTLGQIKQIGALLNLQWGAESREPPAPVFEIGKTYLIRTVTMIDTGKVVQITPQWIVLEDAAWIADTGRFSDSVEKAEFDEVEPFPVGKVGIGIGAIIDFCEITKAPRKQK
jgi:hypothetical protein